MPSKTKRNGGRRNKYNYMRGSLAKKKIARLKTQTGEMAKYYLEKRQDFLKQGTKGREGRKFGKRVFSNEKKSGKTQRK